MNLRKEFQIKLYSKFLLTSSKNCNGFDKPFTKSIFCLLIPPLENGLFNSVTNIMWLMKTYRFILFTRDTADIWFIKFIIITYRWLFNINNGWNVRRFLEFPDENSVFWIEFEGERGIWCHGNLNSESIHSRDLINGNSGGKNRSTIASIE